jgi:hypothetical protein
MASIGYAVLGGKSPSRFYGYVGEIDADDGRPHLRKTDRVSTDVALKVANPQSGQVT